MVRPKTGLDGHEVDSAQGINEFHLVGRLSGGTEERALPSGDTVVQLRLVVARDGDALKRRPGSTRMVTVDTIDVTVWAKSLQRKLSRCSEGSIIEVRGSLRRRFWRSPRGPASRYEVEASSLALISASHPQTQASSGRRTMSG